MNSIKTKSVLFGVPVEFNGRQSRKNNPVTDMIG